MIKDEDFNCSTFETGQRLGSFDFSKRGNNIKTVLPFMLESLNTPRGVSNKFSNISSVILDSSR